MPENDVLGGKAELIEWEERLRHRIRDSLKSRSGSKLDPASERLVEYLPILPDLFRLGVALLFDSALPEPSKGVLIAALGYVVSPIDVIPDAIPVAGWVDDLFAMALGLQRFVEADLAARRPAVARHWSGNVDVMEAVRQIVEAAETARTFLSPQRLALLKNAIPTEVDQGWE